MPVVLLVGVLLTPVTSRSTSSSASSYCPPFAPALTVCFEAGGPIGVAAASIREYQALRDLGTLPMFGGRTDRRGVKLAGLVCWGEAG